ncbi:MAG: 4-hydroxythreonine-4-phosphate dehydrogenase PdxA [Magnetococcus sp. DMHC-6]
MVRRPIAFTMGDPTGIGPEIVLKAVQKPLSVPFVWIGDPEVLMFTASHLGLSVAIEVISQIPTGSWPNFSPGTIPVLAMRSQVEIEKLTFGHPQAVFAGAIIESIQTACELALCGTIDAVVTPPIHKAVLHAGGFTSFPGHTEMLAAWSGGVTPVMMLAGAGLRVVPVTIHLPLAGVSREITYEKLIKIMEITLESLRRDFALPHPRLAVAGLNPHAGENGFFGREEIEVIGPVCQEMVNRGFLVSGPWPSDTLFHAKARGEYDAVVCMYHDQALIPLKMLSFGRAVNITLGLPFVRTSVDHGTAFDIAGEGRADPSSLLAAIEMAGMILDHRVI